MTFFADFVGAARYVIKRKPALHKIATSIRTAGRRISVGYQRVDGLPGRIHYADLSYQERMPYHYRVAAESGIDVIGRALSLAKQTFADVNNVLDYACGYGRVLRLIRKYMPDAQVHACDIVPQAVAFCAEEFGVTAFTVSPDSEKVRLECQYEVIWVGSLFSHLRQDNFKAMLSRLASALVPGGILIITTHGRFSLNVLQGYGLPLPDRSDIDSILQKEGAFFAPYAVGGGDYGFALCEPSFVEEAIDALPQKLKLLGYWPRGWDAHQDVYVVQRQTCLVSKAPYLSP